MNARETWVRCGNAIEDGVRVLLALDRPPSGSFMRLFGKGGGPLGEVTGTDAHGHALALFNPIEVLQALVDRGMVSVSFEPCRED